MRHPASVVVSRTITSCVSPADIRAYAVSFLLTALVLAFVVLSSGRASAESQPHVARLSQVDGAVQILRGTQTEFEHAVANMPLPEGSRVVTGSDGRAEVQFDNGSIARLTPNSSMTLTQIQRGLEGAADTQIEMLSGMGYFQLRSRGGDDSVISATNTVTTVDGPATFRINMDAVPGEISVLDGRIHVAGGTHFAVDVQTNETIRFDANDAARYYLAQGVAPDSWDQWNDERDQALAQQAVKRTDVASNSTAAGWGDLDQYGNWYTVPGYGNVWSPAGVGMGWDPYGSGYWGQYPGSGYTWISGYPWGWLPYQCGGWNYFNSFGWGWMPTNCGYGGGYYPNGPVIINGPPGYRPPPRPRPTEVIAVNGTGAPNRIVRVDRGTHPLPQPGNAVSVARPIVVNGTVIHPLQPKPAQGAAFVGGARAPGVHPLLPAQRPTPMQSPMQSMTHPNATPARAPYAAPAAGMTHSNSGVPIQIMAPGPPTSRPSMQPMSPSAPRMSAPQQPMSPSAPRMSAPPQQPHYSAPSQPSYSAPSQPHYSAPSAAPAQAGHTSSK